jgi:hypothetical protein
MKRSLSLFWNAVASELRAETDLYSRLAAGKAHFSNNYAYFANAIANYVQQNNPINAKIQKGLIRAYANSLSTTLVFNYDIQDLWDYASAAEFEV